MKNIGGRGKSRREKEEEFLRETERFMSRISLFFATKGRTCQVSNDDKIHHIGISIHRREVAPLAPSCSR